jgi:hypothetical protein
MPGDVLQGLAGCAARDERLVPLLLGVGQLALGMRVEMGAVAVRGVKEQDLGAEARRVNVNANHPGGLQPG